jgi:hypothetical protein
MRLLLLILCLALAASVSDASTIFGINRRPLQVGFNSAMSSSSSSALNGQARGGFNNKKKNKTFAGAAASCTDLLRGGDGGGGIACVALPLRRHGAPLSTRQYGPISRQEWSCPTFSTDFSLGWEHCRRYHSWWGPFRHCRLAVIVTRGNS